jgi:nitroreductase
MFNDLTSLPRYLSSRRSGKARELVAPGADAATLQSILVLAARTPDHGKLFPWRFVIIRDREAFAALLKKAFLTANPDARAVQIDAAVAPAFQSPTLIVLMHATQPSAKIPEWEQQLSTGAVAMNLLHAFHAFGFAANWITGWAAYDENVRISMCEVNERVAGFFYAGTVVTTLEERPRPDMSAITRVWPVADTA